MALAALAPLGRTYYAFGCEWLRHFIAAARSAGAPLNEVLFASIHHEVISLALYFLPKIVNARGL